MFDNWMEDCINGGYGEELDRLEADDQYDDDVDLYGAEWENHAVREWD